MPAYSRSRAPRNARNPRRRASSFIKIQGKQNQADYRAFLDESRGIPLFLTPASKKLNAQPTYRKPATLRQSILRKRGKRAVRRFHEEVMEASRFVRMPHDFPDFFPTGPLSIVKKYLSRVRKQNKEEAIWFMAERLALIQDSERFSSRYYHEVWNELVQKHPEWVHRVK